MIIIDTHCDALWARSREGNIFTKDGAYAVTPERLREGGVTLQVCALFAGPEGPNGKGDMNPATAAQMEYAALPQFTQAGIAQVTNPLDIQDGTHNVMLSIEGGEIIADSLDALVQYYDLGVRMFGLVWNHENLIGSPHCVNGQRRLTPFGWEVVKKLNALGMAVDVAHLGEGGFWDLVFHAQKPPMTSHSCCRKLCNHTRNLTDDQIRALIDCGGWMGINFYTCFLTDNAESNLDILIDHIAHVADLGGIKHVGFGSDFDGIDSAPQGLEHPGKMPNLMEALIRRGFSQAEIEDIAGKNFQAYWARMLP